MNEELNKLVIDLFNEECDIDEEYENFKVIEDGVFTSSGKYQYSTSIVKYKDQYFEIGQTRSGSYHSDYEYHDDSIREVKPVEKTVVTTTWEAV